MAAEPRGLVGQNTDEGGSSMDGTKMNGTHREDTAFAKSNGLENNPEEGSEADGDAEGDTDDEIDTGADADADGSDEEIEAPEDAEGDEDDYDEAPTIKRPKRKRISRDEDDINGDVSEDSVSPELENDSDNSSSSESESENEWEAESDEEEETPAEATDPNCCWFCKQSEENDPNPEYEEYLACAVCGDNAHRGCARDANALQSDEDASRWRCPTCIENGFEEEENDLDRRKSSGSASRAQRDSQPSHRGASKPDSDSAFDNQEFDHGLPDDSRSLRKRKGSESSEDPLAPTPRKRRRRSDAVHSVTDDVASLHSGPSTINVAHSGARVSVDVASGDEELEPPRSARSRRSRKTDKPIARVVEAHPFSLVLAFSLDAIRLSKILSSKPKKKRIRDRSKKTQLPPPEPEISHYPAIQTSNWAAALYSLQEKENDELKSKPYGGILSEAEAETSKTFPMAPDRKRFEDARLKAEEDWKKKIQAASHAAEPIRAVQKMSGPPSKIKCINLGGYEIDTWHAAPYPEEYSRNKVLYICEFCLKYMNSDYVAWRHKLKCPAKHPPGDEIYRDGPFSFFEVDGRKNPVYCQNLCLLAKLFLGSKTLYYDVEPFLFYVMTENDDFGCHFVGYFSKEKRPSSQNNVSCILVLPIHQRRGFGHFLIDFSYLLTRVENKTGSPEKPLSDMGLVSYRSYWRLILCRQLSNQAKPLSISQLSDRTGMTADDIVSALEGLRALVRDPVTKTYALRLDYAFFDEYIKGYEKKGYVKLNPDALVWTPYVMGRGNLATYEQGPAIQTVAQREDEGEETAVAPEEGVQMANGTSHNNTAKLAEQTERSTFEPKLRSTDSTESKAPNGSNTEDLPAQPVIATPSISLTTVITSSALVNGTNSTTNHADHADQQSIIPNSATTPFTSLPNLSPASTIPPTRFEIFPPIPGLANRRRAGRPFARNGASARRNGTATPGLPRRASERVIGGQGGGSPKVEDGGLESPARRTRSRLGVVDGEGEEENGAVQNHATGEDVGDDDDERQPGEHEGEMQGEESADMVAGDGEGSGEDVVMGEG
ncbi:MAG: hypothetical protein M1820_004371 [Bogoriella megaspora]|nr:MAG: hypothetical protein M1820_004371 [Bogoriella megaspora]